ncbi:MAG: hypothetical protein JSV44_12400 [Candidatus Zixiibacteriota bacterium]|nr:MAG: hypothetical protein JSV44_12400 [candidate division Zixibacteria bacterium]
MRKRPLILWFLAVMITFSSVVYQRLTGPTHSVRGSLDIGGEIVKFRLLRTHVTTSDATMNIAAPDSQVTGFLGWRRYKSHDTLRRVELERQGENLLVRIPKQPAAGKVIYQVTLVDAAGTKYELTEQPVIIRFKGPVPISVLILHVILMFAGMLLSTRAGLGALSKEQRLFRLTAWTSALIFIGGLIFGPIVQKLAFGEFWTGWPWGHDLTDSKTAFAMIFWLMALWRTRKSGKGRYLVVAAAVVTLLVYLIPHSVLGSELDYTKSGV